MRNSEEVAMLPTNPTAQELFNMIKKAGTYEMLSDIRYNNYIANNPNLDPDQKIVLSALCLLIQCASAYTRITDYNVGNSRLLNNAIKSHLLGETIPTRHGIKQVITTLIHEEHSVKFLPFISRSQLGNGRLKFALDAIYNAVGTPDALTTFSGMDPAKWAERINTDLKRSNEGLHP